MCGWNRLIIFLSEHTYFSVSYRVSSVVLKHFKVKAQNPIMLIYILNNTQTIPVCSVAIVAM